MSNRLADDEFEWTYGRGRRRVRYVSKREHVCVFCGRFAVVKLPPALRAIQTDGTTHVCHPSAGGCNHGFADGGTLAEDVWNRGRT